MSFGAAAACLYYLSSGSHREEARARERARSQQESRRLEELRRCRDTSLARKRCGRP